MAGSTVCGRTSGLNDGVVLPVQNPRQRGTSFFLSDNGSAGSKKKNKNTKVSGHVRTCKKTRKTRNQAHSQA